MADVATTQQVVREYYGQTVQSKSDLRTSACCAVEPNSPRVASTLELIEPEILDKFYGCGSPIPVALEGRTVLDLGCGTGRDTYVVARLVWPRGRVIGVDMTEQQLAVARRHLDTQMARFGYDVPNVDFRHGLIEDLAAIGLADASVDVVISNCVINLSPDKRSVFSEIFRVLKPGGELYFSDVFAARRVPRELTTDPVLRGECLGGALYLGDFRRMLRAVGCLDYRVTASRLLSVDDPDLRARVGMVDFRSLTIRAFKLETLEDACEDYGQTARYLGTLPDYPHSFALDENHLFHTNKIMLVCGNTAAMLGETRLGPHFELTGDRSTHFGPFHCHQATQKPDVGLDAGGACC